MVQFLMTIDTEEEGLWSGNYKRHTECTVVNIKYLKSLQDCCNRLGIRPTYLIDYTVATNKNSIQILKEFLDQNLCEIGTHLHPWCNPPYKEEISIRNSYPNNLPVDLQYDKLKTLTAAIEENFQVRPISYRAGRYGFDETSMPVLEDLGYKIDSSIVPYLRNKRPEEPTFGMVSLQPYYLNYEDVNLKGDSKLLEVPISIEFTRNIPSFVKKIYPNLTGNALCKIFRVVFNLVWLRPSYASLDTMKSLCDSIISNNVSVLNMMFHSSELMPGASPHNQTMEDVNIFVEKIKKLVEYLHSRYKIEFSTLSEMQIDI